MKKQVRFDPRAAKEVRRFPKPVHNKLRAYIQILEQTGSLREPFAKKLTAYNLFEIRIKYQGQWRILYAYVLNDLIILLRAFHKKTQKTPLPEISLALKRKQQYE